MLDRRCMGVETTSKRHRNNIVLTSCTGWVVPQPEKRLNTIPYIPVYGHCMPLYGSNLSEYGNIRERIQAFFALCTP